MFPDNSALFFQLTLAGQKIRCLDLTYFDDERANEAEFGIFLDDMPVFGISGNYTEGHILRLLDRMEPLPSAYCFDMDEAYLVGKLKYVPLTDLCQLFMRQAKINDNYQPFALLVEEGVENLPDFILKGYTNLLREAVTK